MPGSPVVRMSPLALVALIGCETPVGVATELAVELSEGRLEDVRRRIHSDYSDPLGDRALLFTEIEALIEQAGPLSMRLSDLEAVRGPRGATVIGKLDATLAAAPTWAFTGPIALELTDGKQVRSGLLPDLREVRSLFSARRAALEANDAQALAALIHPEYRDGFLDKAGAVARLTADLAGTPIRIEPVSYWVEVRGLDAHVDERYIVKVGERSQAAIARFTIRRSAGHWRIWAGLYPP